MIPEIRRVLKKSIAHAEVIEKKSHLRRDLFRVHGLQKPLDQIASSEDVTPFLIAVNNYSTSSEPYYGDVVHQYLLDHALNPRSITNSLASLELYLPWGEVQEFYERELFLAKASIGSVASLPFLIMAGLPNAPYAAAMCGIVCSYQWVVGNFKQRKRVKEFAPYSNVSLDVVERITQEKSLVGKVLHEMGD